MSKDSAYTIFHYEFPPIVLFAEESLAAYLSAIAATIDVERIVSSDGKIYDIYSRPEYPYYVLRERVPVSGAPETHHAL